MDTPLSYSEHPPLVGDYRPMAPQYGEYQYLPPQRWLHALNVSTLENGASSNIIITTPEYCPFGSSTFSLEHSAIKGTPLCCKCSNFYSQTAIISMSVRCLAKP